MVTVCKCGNAVHCMPGLPSTQDAPILADRNHTALQKDRGGKWELWFACAYMSVTPLPTPNPLKTPKLGFWRHFVPKKQRTPKITKDLKKKNFLDPARQPVTNPCGGCFLDPCRVFITVFLACEENSDGIEREAYKEETSRHCCLHKQGQLYGLTVLHTSNASDARKCGHFFGESLRCRFSLRLL